MNVVQENVLKGKSPVGTKQLYKMPVLSEYGDLRHITLSKGDKSPTADGATMGTNVKTS